MALPADDARTQLARMLQARQGAVAPSRSAVQLGRATTRALIANPTLRERIDQIASGEKVADPGRLGGVLGNPIVKTALKGAELFALPGRAVQSTIGEVVDALDDDPLTRASVADWGKRMKDPTTGFGTSARINTGSKWIDRAIGFVGDVALDPITYATFGAGKFAGYAGRTKLAYEVLKNTGDNALAANVARRGRSALRGQPEVLERVGANKFGVYFFGKRIKVGHNGGGLRLPLSGHIGEIGESTLARIRIAITDTRLGKYIQKGTMPKDMLDARLMLARGEGPAENLADYVRFFNMRPAQRAARGVALQAYETELLSLIKQEEALGDLESYRKTIHRFLDNPELLDSATPSERRAFDVWQNYFGVHRTRVEEGFKAVDPAADIKMRTNFFPRSITDDGMKYTLSDTPHSKELRKIFMEDPFATPDSFTPRTLTEGKVFFGKTLDESDLTTEKLNEIARAAGFKGDFFETDIVEAAKKYIQDAADEMGIIERNKILRETGFFKNLEEMRVTALEVDEDAVAAARSRVEEISNSLKGVDEQYRATITQLVDEIRVASSAVDRKIANAEFTTTKLNQYLYDAREKMQELAMFSDRAKAKLLSLFGDPADVKLTDLSSGFPPTLIPVLKQFDDIRDELLKYSDLIDDVEAQITAGGMELNMAAVQADRLEDAANAAMEAFRKSQETVQEMMEMSNVIQAAWDRIVDGGAVWGKSAAHEMMKEVRDVLGLTPGIKPKTVQAKRRAALGVTGSLADFIESSDFRAVFSEFAGNVGDTRLVLKSIRDMSAGTFEQRVLQSMTQDSSLRSLREAMLYVLARDMHAHGARNVDELPEALQAMWGRVAQKMKDAAESESVQLKLVQLGKRVNIKNVPADQVRNKLQDAYGQAKQVLDSIEQMDFASDFFSRLLAVGVADELFTDDMLDALGAAMREAGVRGHPAAVERMMAEGMTVSDMVSEITRRSAMLKEGVEGTKISVAMDERWSNLKQFDGDPTVQMTYRQVIDEYEAAVRELRDEKGVLIGKRLTSRTYNPEAVKQDLATELVMYTAVSDAVAKFQSTAAILALRGVVPDEEMWRGILRTTKAKYAPQFQQKLSHIDDAEKAVGDLSQEFMRELSEAKRLAAITGERVVPSAVFRNVLESALNAENADFLRMAIGPSMAAMVDPFDLSVRYRALVSAVRSADTPEAKLAAKISKENFEKNFLIPWAKSVDPSIRSAAGPANDVLRAYVPSSRSRKAVYAFGSPLSEGQGEKEIMAWLSSFFRKEQRPGDTVGRTVGAPEAPTRGADGVLYDDGRFDRMRDSLWEINRFFRQMEDGYLNPYAFFMSPSTIQETPSSFGAILYRHAKDIESLVGEGRRAGQAATAKETARTASRESQKADAARVIVDAYSDPTLTVEELKKLGFTKQMLEDRDVVRQHQRMMQTVAYAKAVQDKEFIEFLKSVAHIDFSKFEDGIVLGYTTREVLDAPVGDVSAAQARIAELTAQKESIQTQRTAALQSEMSLYSQKTKSGRAQAAKARREFEANGARAYDAEIARIDAEIQRTSAGAGMFSQGISDTPIFAKMPDGSPLVFTKQEWDSLFAPSLSGTEVAALRREQRAMPRMVQAAKKEMAEIHAKPKPYSGASRARLRQLQEFIDAAPARIAEIDSTIAMHSKEFRNAALEKVRILIDEGRGWRQGDWQGLSTRMADNPANPTYRYYADKGVISDVATQTDVGLRTSGLDEMWQATSSYKILDEASQLAATASMKTYRGEVRKLENLASAAEKAGKESLKARTALDETEKALRKIIVDMRMAEIKAAKAAGATFDTMGRTYTLNGKTYEIPSFSQMIRNPEKYASRASKMSDLFFDLRKPGNVAIWADMDTPARASAAMWALHRTAKEAKIASNVYRLGIEAGDARIESLERLVASWTDDLLKLNDSLDSVRKALEVEQRLALDEFKEMNALAVQARLDFWDLGTEIRAAYGDLPQYSGMSLDEISNDMLMVLGFELPVLQKRRQMFQEILDAAPDKRSTSMLSRVKRPDVKARLLQQHKDWIDRFDFEFGELAKANLRFEDARLFEAVMKASTAEARFIREQSRLAAATSELDTLKEGVMVDRVIKPFEAGYKKAAEAYLKEQNLEVAGALNMPSYGVNPEVRKMLSNLARIEDGAVARDLGRMVGQYTGFFKAYATLSPGFHVRNSISNIAQMFAGGADVKNMRRGLHIYRGFGEHLRNGGTLESWMRTPEFARLSDAEKQAARIAADVNFALGGGNVEDAFREFVTLKQNRATYNWATRTSRKVGIRVEGSARFMMAFDSAIKGDDFTMSFNRTKRFLFDYNDPSILDDTVRNIIPFWTWMSRNLPLQIANQWANPKPYVIYQRFANNFGIGQDENVPEYMKVQGAYKVGEDMYLSPDLPWVKLNEQISEFGKPRRLLSYINPALRMPVELAGNTKFYNAQEFSGRYVPVKGVFNASVPLLEALGQIERNSQGEAVMTEKAQYALTGLIPTLGQVERLFPSSDFGDGMAAARYLGAPIRRVDDEARDRELQKRLRAIQALTDKQRRIEEAG